MSDNSMLGLTSVIQIAIPVIAAVTTSILTWIFTRPVDEEARIGRLRKNLLSHFRFKMSIEVSNVLPEKTIEIQKDDYVAICRDKLNEYFSTNSKLLMDFLGCERLFKSYIMHLRCFKYGIIIIPIIGGVIVFILKELFKNEVSTLYYVIVSIVLILIIVFLWFLMEKTKDNYHDLCSKYEVVDDG